LELSATHLRIPKMGTEIVALLAELKSDDLMHRVDQAPQEQTEYIVRYEMTAGEMSWQGSRLRVEMARRSFDDDLKAAPLAL
jgi:hypothetical protein